MLRMDPTGAPHDVAHGSDAVVTTRRRPRAAGKFLYVGDEKFWVRGVTYGTFRLGADGREENDPKVVAGDFRQMAAHGFNAIRTYTVPPLWLLDEALRHGLRVLIGVPWEQHITFGDDRIRARSIERTV